MPKERRKSQKEIYQDNQNTLSFYRNISIVSTIAQLIYVSLRIYWNTTFPWLSIFWVIFALAHHIGGHKMLQYISRAEFNQKGEVLDAGVDLQDAWISEYSKDVILFVSILQCLAVFSHYVWILWIIIPGFAFYKIWILILWPWFKAGSEPIEESKKAKKMRAKMRKIH